MFIPPALAKTSTDNIAYAFGVSSDNSPTELLTTQDMETIQGEWGGGYSISSGHTKQRGSKKRTNDKHTKPRSGRSNTKNRSHRGWRGR